MVRRILAIPLAVVVAIAVSFLPVFAAPSNNVSGDFSYYVDLESSSSSSIYCYLFSSKFGNSVIQECYFYLDSVLFNSSVSVRYPKFSLTSSVDSLYIMVFTASLLSNYIELGPLFPYYNPSGNITEVLTDVPVTYVNYYCPSGISQSSTASIISSGTSSYSVTYLSFKDVPVGDYYIRDWSVPYTDGKFWLCFGLYLDSNNFLSSSVDSYLSGNLSFVDAVSNINSNLDYAIDSTSDIFEQQFYVSQARYELDRLLVSSDERSLSTIQTSGISGFNQYIDSFVSGSLSLDQTIDSLNSLHSSLLSSSETPEQGVLVNTLFDISLKQLELQARRKSYDRLESAIVYDQLLEADQYYDEERYLINLFEVADFESALDFQLWFNTLPPSETTEYKKFFDYLLNDSSIRMFLVVPISLILVRILLGTYLVLSRGGDHSSRSSVLSSDDHYRFFGDDQYRGS